ncbi:5-formyltetrahydrofolate cyclo-ligase [Stenotrophomonas sp. 24(2023)]|uniref:5-formyltetrahydrofolate cyclo-ligase n=1 Tax=Stenotrophomonas sp. 24(2023) TaxID=3068324 RepID=UPI0027E1F0FA|nr:5-formyltetrahydrofolate cyclo-ligase [Stenotrophomonas sp. 24(2023)]WMJ70374.1 5-formyltetrahydrofolate cyclo-ligase [Stenotrophomonas sp. 24(2023)]
MTDPRPDLRHDLRQRRRALPAPARLAAAETLADALLALPFAPTHGPVAGYWALDGEIALHRWQLQLPATLTYCLPVLHGEVLRFAPWRPGQALTANRYGIPEPDLAIEDTFSAEQMALVVTPLVGFDTQCRRLGMGGGWYDRSFAFRHQRAAPPWLVGAAFSLQQVDALPVASWDVPVDAICTEQGTLFPLPPHVTA